MNFVKDQPFLSDRAATYVGAIHAKDHSRVFVGNHYSVFQNSENDKHLHDEAERTALRADFYQKLSVSPYKERKDRNPNRADGTCQWFIAHDLFQKWQAKESGLLWVSADPGCGKSVLLRHLVDNVVASDNSRITSYFFFKDDLDDQGTLEGALCSILHQIFTQQPSLLKDSFLNSFKRQGVALCASFKSLWKILLEATQSSPKAFVCVLDALDECNNEKPLAEALTILYEESGQSTNLKFLISSRPYNRIHEGFQTLKKSQPTIHLSGESPAESDQIAREITITIRQRVEHLGEKLSLRKDETEFLHNEITSVENRTYLWVHLVFAVIEEAIVFSRQDWHATIHTMPRTVEEAYEKILQKSRDPRQARKILQIVTGAARPLSLTEMGVALTIQADLHQSYRSLENDLLPEDRLRVAVREACGLFVVIHNSRIFLLHQTARSFLIQLSEVPSSPLAHSSPTSVWQHTFTIKSCHRLLAVACMHYALLLNDSTPSGSEGHNAHFIDYAADYWTSHYRRARGNVMEDEKLIVYAIKLCHVKRRQPQRWLIQYYGGGAEVRKEMVSPILIASHFGLADVVHLMLTHTKLSPSTVGGLTGKTALSYACEEGHLKTIQTLLENVSKHMVRARAWCGIHSFVTKADFLQRTPIWYAASSGNSAAVKLLLEKGAAVNRRDLMNLSPSTIAMEKGHSDVVDLLTQRGAHIDNLKDFVETADGEGRTPLMTAIEADDETTFRLLLRQTTNVDYINSHRGGFTALISASRWGRKEMVKELLSRHADVEARDFLGRTPLMHASFHGHSLVVNMLLSNGAIVHSVDDDGDQPLSYAASGGHGVLVEKLLDAGAPIGVADNDGDTALTMAALRGHVNVVKTLLDRGASITAVDSKVVTALMQACEAGHEAVVLELLSRGAELEARGDHQQISLMIAAAYGHPSIVQVLLNRGANIEASDDYQQTPLILASKRGCEKVVEELLKRGAFVEAYDKTCKTPLLWAAQLGHVGVVMKLLAGGARTDVMDRQNRTVLKVALHYKQHAVCHLLRSRGAEESVPSSPNGRRVSIFNRVVHEHY